MNRALQRPWLLVLGIGVAGLLFLYPLARNPRGIPFAPGADYSDALVAHLSNALFLNRAIATWGEIPLWNPTILSGMPFAADPLSGLWYPPLWLLGAFPGAPALNLLFWAHLVLGGVGMFLLLREEGLARLAALGGGLMLTGMPKVVAHVGLGHLTLVSAVAWSPWVLLCVGRAVEGVGRPRSLRRFVLAGALVGLVFVADPRWLVPISLAAVGYAAWRLAAMSREDGRRSSELLKGAAVAVAASVAVGASLAVPLAEFVALSTRPQVTVATADAYALPAARLLGLLVVVPSSSGEWTVSMGSISLVLAVAGVAAFPKRTVFWTSLLILSIILSLGQATPLGGVLGAIPGMELMRVPPRWMFFAGIGAAALSAYGLSALDREGDRATVRRVRLATLFTGAVILTVSLALTLLSGGPASLSGFFAALAVVGVWVGTRSPRGNAAAPVLVLLLVSELLTIDLALVESRPIDQATLGTAQTAPGSARTYSISYVIPQEAAAEAGLELADGVHPLQLAGYVDFMGAASGFATDSYSVTLPPFPSGDPTVDWGAALDAQALGQMAIGRVLSSYPIEADGLALEDASGGVWSYRNDVSHPRAWVWSPRGSSAESVGVIDWRPNRIAVRASGPGVLVLSELSYPGWRATVDGQPVALGSYQNLLRSVPLGGGEHVVELRFIPASLLLGSAIALLAGAAAVVAWRRP